MNVRKIGNSGKIAAVIIACCMMAADGEQKRSLSTARAASPKWFCIAVDPVGIIIDYKKAQKGKSSCSDTCSSVWFHDSYGYKLYLKNGDSVRICPKCLIWGNFLEFQGSDKVRGKSKKHSSSQETVKKSDNIKKEKKKKKK
ncbi:MAG: hypothetical protein JXA71_09710 [Chitinispirillaceae bacterium]|nr:hypothetical protein [Chitinispirillaceae bacterium]